MFDKLHLVNNEVSLDRIVSNWLGVRFSEKIMNKFFNFLKDFYDEWIYKIVITLTYLFLIACILYSPRLFEHFSDQNHY